MSNDEAQKTIGKSYKPLAIKHHPDKGGDATLFREICRAHELLKQEKSRYTYSVLKKHGYSTERALDFIDNAECQDLQERTEIEEEEYMTQEERQGRDAARVVAAFIQRQRELAAKQEREREQQEELKEKEREEKRKKARAAFQEKTRLQAEEKQRKRNEPTKKESKARAKEDKKVQQQFEESQRKATIRADREQKEKEQQALELRAEMAECLEQEKSTENRVKKLPSLIRTKQEKAKTGSDFQRVAELKNELEDKESELKAIRQRMQEINYVIRSDSGPEPACAAAGA